VGLLRNEAQLHTPIPLRVLRELAEDQSPIERSSTSYSNWRFAFSQKRSSFIGVGRSKQGIDQRPLSRRQFAIRRPQFDHPVTQTLPPGRPQLPLTARKRQIHSDIIRQPRWQPH
jgi:hypothetical protein